MCVYICIRIHIASELDTPNSSRQWQRGKYETFAISSEPTTPSHYLNPLLVFTSPPHLPLHNYSSSDSSPSLHFYSKRPFSPPLLHFSPSSFPVGHSRENTNKFTFFKALIENPATRRTTDFASPASVSRYSLILQRVRAAPIVHCASPSPPPFFFAHCVRYSLRDSPRSPSRTVTRLRAAASTSSSMSSSTSTTNGSVSGTSVRYSSPRRSTRAFVTCSAAKRTVGES